MTPQQHLVHDAYNLIRAIPATHFHDSELDILPDRHRHVGELDNFLRQFYTFLLMISSVALDASQAGLVEVAEKQKILYAAFLLEIRRRFPDIPRLAEILICRNFSVVWVNPDKMWAGEVLTVKILSGDYSVAHVGLKKPSPLSEEGSTV